MPLDHAWSDVEMIYGAISIETAFAGVCRDWHAVEHSMLKEENNPC